jgi:ethanolamine utilization cobalamin adenosyltransferase
MLLPAACKEYTPPPGAFVTPDAREYLVSRGIELREDPKAPETMPVEPIPKRGKSTYVDAETGEFYAEKPEHMTHLRGNLLVPKTHRRIAFRGALDSLEADVLEAAVLAADQGEEEIKGGLGEILLCLRGVMSAEVKETPLEAPRLFGLSAGELREQTHDVKSAFGIAHPNPDYTMGPLAVRLNTLRTRVRGAELLAVKTFCPHSEYPRNDIILTLNRLSSAVYWLFCRHISRRNPQGTGEAMGERRNKGSQRG